MLWRIYTVNFAVFSFVIKCDSVKLGLVMMKNILVLSLLLTFFMAINVDAQNDKTSAAIRKVMDDQAVAWNRGDLEGFMQGYWKSEKMTFVSGTNVARGWQQALDRYKKGYDTKEKMGTLSFTDLEITVLSKDSAVVLGSWKVATITGKDKAAKDSAGKFTLIFRKFKDGWKVVHDHTS